jgi:hypothetical protein
VPPAGPPRSWFKAFGCVELPITKRITAASSMPLMPWAASAEMTSANGITKLTK